MEKYCVVKTIVANLYKQPSFTSELVTQALLKEKLLILDQKNNWYKIKQWDNYESWIHSFYLLEQKQATSNGWDILEIEKKSVNELISYAKSFLGVPYLWGGKSSSGLIVLPSFSYFKLWLNPSFLPAEKSPLYNRF